jgi:hypothetical protein
LLQELQDQVASVEQGVMRIWKQRFLTDEKHAKSWVLPWAQKNLYLALLTLWKVHLPTGPPATDIPLEIDAEQIKQTKADQLPKDQRDLSLQFCEAMASWVLMDKHIKPATEMPLKPTDEGRLFWPFFLGGGGTNSTEELVKLEDSSSLNSLAESI